MPSAPWALANGCCRAANITLCEHFTLIGSGLIWNVYFGVLALLTGFFLASRPGGGQGQSNPLCASLRVVHLRVPRLARCLSSSSLPTPVPVSLKVRVQLL